MKLSAFKRVVRFISQEETDEFVMLIGMFGSDRAFVNEVDVAGQRAQITAKHVINQWASLDDLRIDNNDKVYLLKSIHDKIVANTMREHSQSKMMRREEERDRANKMQMEIGEPAPPEPEPEPEPEVSEPIPEPVDSNEPPPLPDCKPWEAEGEDLQMIQAHNNWLREHGRSNEQVVPF